MTSVRSPRSERLRAPLLVALTMLLGFETAGGLVIFFARLANGTLPGETLHVVAGTALVVVYCVYQWQHWLRVRTARIPLDRLLGFLTAACMLATLATGLLLGWDWFRHRAAALPGNVPYLPLLSAAHNIGSMLVVAFVAAHVGAVLQRDRRGTTGEARGEEETAAPEGALRPRGRGTS